MFVAPFVPLHEWRNGWALVVSVGAVFVFLMLELKLGRCRFLMQYQKFFKKMFSVFALVITAGMLVFCISVIAFSADRITHDMRLEQSAHILHTQMFAHAEDVLMSAIAKIVRAVVDLGHILLIIAFSFLFALAPSSGRALVQYLRQTFFDALYYVRRSINSWLSLFELSPTFI